LAAPCASPCRPATEPRCRRSSRERALPRRSHLRRAAVRRALLPPADTNIRTTRERAFPSNEEMLFPYDSYPNASRHERADLIEVRRTSETAGKFCTSTLSRQRRAHLRRFEKPQSGKSKLRDSDVPRLRRWTSSSAPSTPRRCTRGTTRPDERCRRDRRTVAAVSV